MSADLLAAFGNGTAMDEASDKTESSQRIDQVIPRPEPWRIVQRNPYTTRTDRPLWERDDEGNDVLFDAADSNDDADDEDGKEDFGDFEAAENAMSPKEAVSKHNVTALKLLDLDDDIPVTQQFSRAQMASLAITEDGSDPFDVFNHGFKHQQPLSQMPIVTNNNEEDEWGDFEQVLQGGASKKEREAAHSAMKDREENILSDDESWEAFEDGPTIPPKNAIHEIHLPKSVESPRSLQPAKGEQDRSVDRERPTNIPPPYSLLNLLTLAVQRIASQSKTQASVNNQLAIANGIVSLYRTTSRVIAGRTQRWKRDTILAQSMRISQVSQKTTGMKLTALDRSETIKEDQEAIEAVTAWTKHNHILNPILSKAKVQKPAMSLSADMKIRTASGPGVLNDRESCAICGLKRNERVLGVDMKADDIFEEFWIGHWGHADCQNFWCNYKDLLGQR